MPESADNTQQRAQARKELREQEEARLQEQLAKVKYRLLVLSGKGGVGKSTVAVNVAVQLSLEDRQVGLLDVDLHGPNVPTMLGLQQERLVTNEDRKLVPVRPDELEHLQVLSIAFMLDSDSTPVIWRGPLKHGVIRQFISDVAWGELDYLVVDSPPGTGDEPLSVAQTLGKVDLAIVVTTPQDVSLVDAKKAVNFAKTVGIQRVGVLENMSGLTCPHCGQHIDLFGTGGGKKLAEEFDCLYLGAVPMEPLAVKAGDTGQPVMVNPDLKERPIAQAFRDVVERIQGVVESGR